MSHKLVSRGLLVISSLVSTVFLSSSALAYSYFTASPSPLVVGQAGTITVNSVPGPNNNTLIVMPGTDFIPSNGNCITHLRTPSSYLPRNIWICYDHSAPIVFNSPSVGQYDLVDGNALGLPYYALGYVGFIASGGFSRGALTLNYPMFMFGQTLASTL